MSEATRFDEVNAYNRKFRAVKFEAAKRSPETRHPVPAYLPVGERDVRVVPEGWTLRKVLRQHF